MSQVRGLCSGTRRALLSSVLLALASAAAMPSAAGAQGGGMGGFGRGGGMGGGMGGGRHGGFNSTNSNAPNVSKPFEELASLKGALKHVDSLTKDQKRLLSGIEHSYHQEFKAIGHVAQEVVDSAHAQQEPPDPDRIDSLHKQAVQLRDKEFAEARDLLATDEQRNQFDQNVAQLRDKEAKREEDMEDQLDRMGQMPAGGGMRGPM